MLLHFCYRILLMLYKKFLIIPLFFIFCSSFNLSYGQSTANNSAVQINFAGSSGIAIAKEGLVYVKRANTDYWQPLQTHDKLYPMDTIQTDKNSICEIKLYGGHVLRLEPESNFSFAEKNPGIDKWGAFKLNAGKLWIKVINNIPNAENFTLETPHASISVKGTIFSVEAPHGKIVVYEGTLELTQQNRHITLNAGEQSRINQIGFMTNPEQIDQKEINSFEELEKNSSILNESEVQTIKTKIILPIKTILDKKANQQNILNNKLQSENLSNNLSTQNTDIIESKNNANEIAKKNEELLISKDKTISIMEDSVLFRNPAILSKVPINKTNSVYFAIRHEFAITNFDNNHKKNSYISNPSQVNAGINSRIEENQMLGVRTLERDTGVGVYFKKQKYLEMIASSNANLYQHNILNLFFGKSLQINDKTNLGALIRSSIITSTKESKTSFTESFSNIFDSRDQSSNLYYSLDVGLLHSVNQNFSLGLSYKGLYAHDPLNIEQNNDNRLFLSGFFFTEHQTIELSLKNHKTDNVVLLSGIFQIPKIPYALFTAKMEYSNIYSLYSIMANIKSSDTFQVFVEFTNENMRLVADNNVLIVGGQLDF